MRTKYRVKVRRARGLWGWWCQGCNSGHGWSISRWVAHAYASGHAAHCEELHWRNWEAACPSCCKAYGGVIAPACPSCQGYGWIKGEA